jgi:hypothetical protein
MFAYMEIKREAVQIVLLNDKNEVLAVSRKDDHAGRPRG